MTNCVNCGAPLHGNVCEYCGTEYNAQNRHIEANFNRSDLTGTLKVAGHEFKCYLSCVNIETIDGPDFGRDITGCLYRHIIGQKHTFTLIEV